MKITSILNAICLGAASWLFTAEGFTSVPTSSRISFASAPTASDINTCQKGERMSDRPLAKINSFSIIATPTSTTTQLQLSNKQNNDDKNMGSIGGTNQGPWILGFVFVVSVWLFSIPPEFRRARNCSAEEVRLYPNSKCMTTEMWVGGVMDYYKNGGGLSFDFSIEGQD